MTIEDRIEQVIRQISLKQYPVAVEDYEIGYNDGLYEAVRYLELILELAEIEGE